MDTFDQIVLTTAEALHAEGLYPTVPRIRGRLAAPATPGLTKFYQAVARLRCGSLFPVPKSRTEAARAGCEFPRRNVVRQRGPLPGGDPKPDRFIGPFADDMRRSRKVLRWARKFARKPREDAL